MNLTKLSVISCEYQGTTLPYSSPTHFHPYFELVYYISGEGYGYIDDKKYKYHAAFRGINKGIQFICCNF